MSGADSNKERTIGLVLNGRPVAARIAVHETLVEVLHREFDLGGARESCAQGLCGCCTVLVDGKPVSGCLFLAAFADGAKVDTIEGLAVGDALSPVQQAFIDSGAFQCGFCTPGFILMATKLIEENPTPDDATIRHYLAGNLCRCGTYPEIIAAVKLAAARVRSARHG